jgi:hypothetical protein
MWVLIFDINIILHHIIISFRITLHHTLYCINKKIVQKKKCSSGNIQWILKQCAEAQGIPSADTILHNREIFVSNVIIQQSWQSMRYSINKGGNFSLRSMKRREGVFFTEGSKMVCTQISHITKKYITLIYIQIFDV